MTYKYVVLMYRTLHILECETPVDEDDWNYKKQGYVKRNLVFENQEIVFSQYVRVTAFEREELDFTKLRLSLAMQKKYLSWKVK